MTSSSVGSIFPATSMESQRGSVLITQQYSSAQYWTLNHTWITEHYPSQYGARDKHHTSIPLSPTPASMEPETSTTHQYHWALPQPLQSQWQVSPHQYHEHYSNHYRASESTTTSLPLNLHYPNHYRVSDTSVKTPLPSSTGTPSPKNITVPLITGIAGLVLVMAIVGIGFCSIRRHYYSINLCRTKIVM